MNKFWTYSDYSYEGRFPQGGRPLSLLSKCQSVKRIAREGPSLHQNTSWWPGRVFSGDSLNTHCRRWRLFRFVVSARKCAWCANRQGIGVKDVPYNSLKNDASADLLESQCHYFGIGFPYSLHRIAKQYCLSRETILFDEANTSVWRVKQYCLERQREVFRVNKAKMNGR